MYNGHAASHIPHSQGRSKHVRHTSDPLSRHESPSKWSYLGNARGTPYIPVQDKKHTPKSQRRTHPYSAPASPLSLPVPEGSVQPSDSSPLHQDREAGENGQRNQIQFADELPDLGPSLVHAAKEEVGPDSRLGSIHSALSSTSSISPHSTGALLRPYHVSSGDLNLEPESYLLKDRGRSVSFPCMGLVQQNFVSLPQDHGEDYGQSREDSTSSVSSYLRANAFLGHRDTLARIKHSANSTGSSSASLALYPSSTIPSIPSSLLTRHRDTFARINYRRRPALPVPKAVFKGLLQYLTFDEYKALRLTCLVWLPSLPPPQLPASYRIPSELLQEVYSLLSPIDFDAARHTCRSWFVASLERRLLETMSRRAGCYGSTQADFLVSQDYYDERRRSMSGHMWAEHDSVEIDDCHQPEIDDLISEEWVYSKRLAIESMLSPDWKGISLKHHSASSTDVFARMTSMGSIAFSFVSEPQHRSINAPSPMPGNGFTVSGCGKFVLITSNRVVFVCELLRRKPGIQPLTRIVCPRKVLGVSMDTSSKRYAVAVLLEGRVGMCCSLTDGFGDATLATATQGDSIQLGMSADVRGSDSVTATPRPTVSALPLRRAEVISSIPGGRFYMSRACEAFISPASNITAEPGPDRTWFDETFSGYSLREDAADSDQEAKSTSGIPIENGTRTVYNNLCSFDDPPRSVAICPQRRCVAFGCRMGIELHWVDALTGSDLNRWFPLAAPSDYLYFLPARHGMDSAKKLRLISSAAGPYTQQKQQSTSLRGSPPSRMNWRASPNGSRRQSMTTLFFGNLPFPTTRTIYGMPDTADQSGNTSPNYPEGDQGVLRTVDCDHYRAVPLSDGTHLLFTDPETGYLCLGSDAPLGGPTKLLRKVICVPPDVEDTEPYPEETEQSCQTPSQCWLTCYTAGRDLRWGVRIVAAYSDGRIILYCVSRDVFENLRSATTGVDIWDEKAGLIGQNDLLMDILMQRDLAPNEAGALAEGLMDMPSFRSLALRGVEIGRSSGQTVDDIAVSCDFGGLKVWAFMRNGLVRMWTLFRMASGREETWTIGKDGIVRNKEEAARIGKEVTGRTMNRRGTPGSDRMASPTVIDQFKSAGVSSKKGKGKEGSDLEGQEAEKPQHIRFVGSGLDGAAEEVARHRGPVKRSRPSRLSPEGNHSYRADESLSSLLVSESAITAWRLECVCPSCERQDVHERLEITILSDWRGVQLLNPYTILLE